MHFIYFEMFLKRKKEYLWNFRVIQLNTVQRCVSSHLAGGRCSPQCNRPAGEAPAVLTFSLCNCTWRTYTDSPATQRISDDFTVNK